MKTIKWTSLILAVLVGQVAMAGVVFRIETTDHLASPPESQTIEISAQDKLLMANLNVGADGSEGRVIYRGDRGQMVVVDDASKSYFTLDKQQVAAMTAQMNQAMKQMEEALQAVPEDQRAAVEQMMKQRMPQQAEKGPVTEFKKTTDRAEKNGYSCLRYDVLEDGRKIHELWVTEWKNIEGAAEVADAFEDMGKFVSELTQAFSAAMGGGGTVGPEFGQELFGQLSTLGGFPVHSREFADDGSLKGEFNLRSAEQQKIDPAAFEPPAEYKLNSMFGG